MARYIRSLQCVVVLFGVVDSQSGFHLYTGPAEHHHNEPARSSPRGADEVHAVDGALASYDGAIEASRRWPRRLEVDRDIAGDNGTAETTNLLYVAKVITNGVPHFLRFAQPDDLFALALRHILAHKVMGGEGCLEANCVAGKLVSVMERCQHQVDVDKTESAICFVERAAVPPPSPPPPDVSLLFGFDFKRRRYSPECIRT